MLGLTRWHFFSERRRAPQKQRGSWCVCEESDRMGTTDGPISVSISQKHSWTNLPARSHSYHKFKRVSITRTRGKLHFISHTKQQKTPSARCLFLPALCVSRFRTDNRMKFDVSVCGLLCDVFSGWIWYCSPPSFDTAMPTFKFLRLKYIANPANFSM